MNIVTSPESKAHREGYNQATVANRQGIFNGFRLPFSPSELHTASGKAILEANIDEALLTPQNSNVLAQLPLILTDDTTFAQGEISANAGVIQYSEKRHGKDIRYFHYENAQSMLLDVLNNWTEIYREDGNALMLAAKSITTIASNLSSISWKTLKVSMPLRMSGRLRIGISTIKRCFIRGAYPTYPSLTPDWLTQKEATTVRMPLNRTLANKATSVV